MQSFIDVTGHQKTVIWDHLLPAGATAESVAFLFATVQDTAQSLTLRAKDFMLVGADGFKVQDRDYIELSDECRIAVIKRAHQTKTALIELHSHPFDSPWAPAFSFADMAGFRETVPHLWWRLSDRPYGAIVVAPNGFDALVWRNNPHSPACLTALRVDGNAMLPTNMTLGDRYVSQM